MLNRIFPAAFDNTYRGHRLAFWLLVPLTLLNLVIDVMAILAPDGEAQSADGIPLFSYPPAAAAAVVGVVGFLGLAGLLLGVFRILALTRYRAMIPLIYALLVLEYPAHKAVGLIKPIARFGGTHGADITLVLFGLAVVGLALSVTGKGYAAGRTPS